MFSKLTIVALLVATIASATPGDEPAGTSNVWNKTEKKCNVGKLQCCKIDFFQDHGFHITNKLPTGSTIQKAQDAQQAGLFGPVGAAIGAVNGNVGVNCNPINGFIGVGGVNW
jgi:hypothetical protein